MANNNSQTKGTKMTKAEKRSLVISNIRKLTAELKADAYVNENWASAEEVKQVSERGLAQLYRQLERLN